jgi:N-acetylglutamate synthase-like GNAT family acetyltransferase
MTDFKFQENFFISTDKDSLDIEVIYDFLHNESYWAKGRDKGTIQNSIKHTTLCFGVYKKEAGEQVGFARVISDFTTHAYLCDVFILPRYRGLGLSKRLLESIVHHPDLQGVKKMMLATQDAHSLYEKYGFMPITNPSIYMERFKRNN